MCMLGKGRVGNLGEKKWNTREALRNQKFGQRQNPYLWRQPRNFSRIHVTMACVFSDTRWQKTLTLEITLVLYLPMSKGRTNPIPVCRHSFREIFKKLCQVRLENGERRNFSPCWYFWVGGLGLAIDNLRKQHCKIMFLWIFIKKRFVCSFMNGLRNPPLQPCQWELSCSLKILRLYLSSWPKQCPNPGKSNLPVCGALHSYTPLLYLVHKNNLQISKILPFPTTSNAATWSKSPSFLTSIIARVS